MKLLTLMLALSISTTSALAARPHHRHQGQQDAKLIAINLFKKEEKADKPEKAEKSEKKKEAKGGDEKKSEPKKAERSEEKPVEKAVAKTVVVPSAAVTKPSDPSDPTQLDSALMSVLRDMNKSLKESEEINKYEDPAQRAAVKAALETLDASLVKAAISPNRIVESDLKDRLEKKVVAESWESGDLQLPDGSAASLNVLWAKKVNGLVNISIAGNCNCKANAGGERVGEWVVVISGKSTLDTGFDIQTQSNVNFWLGKLNNVTVDATTCSEGVTSQQKVPTLKALKTDKKRKHAMAAEAVASAKKSISVSEAFSLTAGEDPAMLVRPQTAPKVRRDQREPVAEGWSPHDHPALLGTPVAVAKKTEAVLAPAEPVVQKKTEAQPILEQVQLPSAGAHILLPKRALAGEYITVSVLDSSGQPERFVELNFNDFKATTNAQGKVTFQVPEELPPGASLSVSLAARADSSPERVYVLHPLMRPSSTDIPKIDRWDVNREDGTITIEGHNFDGIAENNRVILDARNEATIRFSSPVELQAQINLVPGGHDVIVQRNGIRSESISLKVPGDRPAEAVASKNKKKS
jgi:hypothetical protein